VQRASESRRAAKDGQFFEDSGLRHVCRLSAVGCEVR
jgi:hypothetical protein